VPDPVFATRLRQGTGRIALKPFQKQRRPGFPARPDINKRALHPASRMGHATCPCLAKTKGFLPLISLYAAPCRHESASGLTF